MDELRVAHMHTGGQIVANKGAGVTPDKVGRTQGWSPAPSVPWLRLRKRGGSGMVPLRLRDAGGAPPTPPAPEWGLLSYWNKTPF